MTTSGDKAIEKILADAEKNGFLKLSKKKLKALPASIGAFNMIDLLHVDLSSNRFVDFPKHLCSSQFLQDIDCSRNSIRSLPDTFRLLAHLQQLDLSYNCLAQLPAPLCELRCLQILLLNNNKLTELPPEMAGLTQLLHLEASNNALQSASPQLASLQRLRVLKLRNNRLMSVPSEWSALQLKCLDLAGNQLQQLPHHYRLLDATLEELQLDLNPMLSPPAAVCARGLRHVMKFLTVESMREGHTSAAAAAAVAKQHSKQPLKQQQQQQNGFTAGFDSAGSASSSAHLRKLHHQQLHQHHPNSSNSSPPKPMPTTLESPADVPAAIDSQQLQHQHHHQQQQPLRPLGGGGSGGRGTVQFSSSSSVMERLQLQSSRLQQQSQQQQQLPLRSGGGAGGVVKSSSFSSALSSHAASGGSGLMSHSPSAYQIVGGVGVDASSASSAVRLDSAAAVGSATGPASLVDTRSISQMKAILECRLSLSLPDTPDALTEALRDGVLLCYLGNQLAPGSIPRVHVPAPGAGQLPLHKSRRNIENFLGLCRRIGLPGSQSFLVTDLMSGARGLLRVANAVVSIEDLAAAKSASPAGP